MVIQVKKRDGRLENVAFDKITSRIMNLCSGLNLDYVDPAAVAQKVVQGVYNGVTTVELDNLAAETAAYMTTQHPDYALLAARIAVSNLHKETTKQFSVVMTNLYNYINPINQKKSPMISDKTYEIIIANADRLNSAVIHSRDYAYNYFGFKTLERSYLLKINGRIAERPQHMLMRVSVGIHGEDIDSAIETYNLMSDRFFTHASPTLFNAGTPRPQLSSCFLVSMKEDSIEGIYDTLTTCALISKSAGGVGLHAHNIRAAGSYIAGTNGYSNGIVPMLRVFNNTARYVDQGGNKRPGAFAVYLEPWHADIYDFLELKKNTGKDENRARDLFLGLWINDLFMKRVESNGKWSLFCPAEAPGLQDVWGDEFEALYLSYERGGRSRRVVDAQHLWRAIIDAQIETGIPYMMYKDACNRKSNQKNLGTIKCSNLCTEIVEFTAPDEVAVCNLASIALPAYVTSYSNSGSSSGAPSRSSPAPQGNLRESSSVSSLPPHSPIEENSHGVSIASNNDSGAFFDFNKLHRVTKVIARNLNKIIDVNYYPVPAARKSNMRHRPIGIGVQGLADTFIKLRMSFDDDAARKLNKDIFETIYHASLEASCEIAQELGAYETYPGSPVSQGILQFDMWDVKPSSGLWDWDALRAKIAQHGIRNSLLVAPMPTASTSQILGNNECFEPYTSNIYTRRVLAGEFQVVNPHLLRTLIDLNMWNDNVKNMIVADNGSVQRIDGIPDEVKSIFRTVWEISQKSVLDMAADRGAYIDQSMSLNIHLAEPSYSKITSMHFHGWKAGLKTGMYYLRTRPAADAIKFTVDQSKLSKNVVSDSASQPGKSVPEIDRKAEISDRDADLSCSIANRFECMSCGS